ncbi:MAG: YbaB/EbfC family nucleoid-associated protein [Gemmataceae bacterium]
MFKQFTQFAGLLGKLPQLKEEFAKFQAKAGDIVAEGKAGGDMVSVSVNGKFIVTKIRLSDEAIKLQDREMLEDLIKAATNQALEKVRKLLSDEAQKVAADMGLPPGLGIPGLS